MHQSEPSKERSKQPRRKPFITIDDTLKKAQELVADLQTLAARKHPLDIRRASSRKAVSKMADTQNSQQIRAGSRTYFVDVEKTAKGKRYLRITESRFKGEGEDRERNSIVVFPEEAPKFIDAISEMAAKLG